MTRTLTDYTLSAKAIKNCTIAINDYRDKVIPAMKELRDACDSLEIIVGKDYWPFPTYSELLFSV